MYRIQNYIYSIEPIVHTIAHSGRLSGHSHNYIHPFGGSLLYPLCTYIYCICIQNYIGIHILIHIIHPKPSIQYPIESYDHHSTTSTTSTTSFTSINQSSTQSIILSIENKTSFNDSNLHSMIQTHSIINQFIHSMTSINRFNQLYTPIYPKTPKNPQK